MTLSLLRNTALSIPSRTAGRGPAAGQQAATSFPTSAMAKREVVGAESSAGLTRLIQGRRTTAPGLEVFRHLEAVDREHKGGQEYARLIVQRLPQVARRIFLTEIEERVSVSPDQMQRIAEDLGIDLDETSRMVQLWQQVFHIGSFHITEEEWKMSPVNLRPLIYRRLRKAFIEGAYLDPYFVAQALEQETPSGHLALETFHNVMMGTARDLPRKFYTDLAAELGIPEHYERLRGWELFWEGQADLWLWNVKPISHSPVGDLLGALEYVRLRGWPLLRFREWLGGWHSRKTTRKNKGPVLDVFDLVIDREVLEGTRSNPRPRPRAVDMAAQMQDPLFRTYLAHWEGVWEELASDLGEERAIRPKSAARTQFAESRQRAALRNKLLKKAREEKLTIEQLHQQLLDHDLIDDAQMLANVCQGIDESERRSPFQMKRNQVSRPTLFSLEKRYESLAKELGYEVKPVSEKTKRHERQHLIRRYVQDVEGRISKEGWDIHQLAAWIRNGTFLPVFGFDGSVVSAILLARWKNGEGVEPSKSKYRREFVAAGGSSHAFEVWWKRAEHWVGIL